MKSYSSVLRKCVKAVYGNWLLVQLPSGRWIGVWHAVLGIEEMCEAVLTESPRFEGDSLAASYVNRGDALKVIVAGIESEIRSSGGRDEEIMKPFLKKARLAVVKWQQKNALEVL